MSTRRGSGLQRYPVFGSAYLSFDVFADAGRGWAPYLALRGATVFPVAKGVGAPGA